MIEDLWLETPSEDPHRDLYKGVIQAAAAIYQWQRGIHSGADGLFKTSVVYLRKYAPDAMGLNVEKLVKELTHFFKVKQKEAMPVLEFTQ